MFHCQYEYIIAKETSRGNGFTIQIRPLGMSLSIMVLFCFRMVVLQFLSLSVNILCLVQKLPQIIRIYQTKNVNSISIVSVLLEETS